ncbi:hypothetical protein [Paenibacillus alvei]|uniref:hypothetical protein n=1 Tax=Paenibacillus alvei TaxID=44250 RepID=UPI00227FE0FF|nr:hypothetical protein [Paenibacillus alvei]
MKLTSSQQLIHQLESNSIELLVLSDQVEVDESRYQTCAFYQDRLVLIARPDHCVVLKRRCTLYDFQM